MVNKRVLYVLLAVIVLVLAIMVIISQDFMTLLPFLQQEETPAGPGDDWVFGSVLLILESPERTKWQQGSSGNFTILMENGMDNATAYHLSAYLEEYIGISGTASLTNISEWLSFQKSGTIPGKGDVSAGVLLEVPADAERGLYFIRMVACSRPGCSDLQSQGIYGSVGIPVRVA